MAQFQYLDRRVQRTKRDIYDAFFELLHSTPYTQVTIKQIIERAGYSRATFYTHYQKKQDLLEDIIQLLFTELKKAYRIPYRGKTLIDTQDFIDEPIFVLEHLVQYKRYYQGLLSTNIQIDFRQRVITEILQLYKDDFTFSEQPVENELMKHYAAYGIINLILDWVAADFPIEMSDFSQYLICALRFPVEIVQVKRGI